MPPVTTSLPASGAEMAVGECCEGLERALQDPLGADVDPASRGHLAVHHQALAVEFVKMLPVGPFPDKIRVGNDYAWRHVVGGKDGHGLAGLDQKGFVVAEMFEFAHDGVKTFPVARGAANAAVDDQVRGALGHFGIEVVHQAAQRGFLLPALAAELIAAGGTNCRDSGDSHKSSDRIWVRALPPLYVATKRNRKDRARSVVPAQSIAHESLQRMIRGIAIQFNLRYPMIVRLKRGHPGDLVWCGRNPVCSPRGWSLCSIDAQHAG